MDPNIRAAILAAGAVFLAFFGAMTLMVIAKDGLTVLTVPSVLIVALLGIAVWGAYSNPPDDRR